MAIAYHVEEARTKARIKLNNSIRDGAILQGICAVCGSTENIDGHHVDYSKPLDVVWLCRLHHRHVSLGMYPEWEPRDVPINGTEEIPPLSDQERHVLGLLFEGRHNKEIAARIGICEQSVKNVIRRIYMKIGVKSFRQMLPIAEEIRLKHMSTKD